MDKLLTVDVPRLREMFPDMYEIEMGKDFFLEQVRFRQFGNALAEPFRMNGYVAIICISGGLDIEANLKSFHLAPNMAYIYITGNILQIKNVVEDGQYVVMALSTEYISTLELDLNALFNDSMAILASPCFSMTEEELDLCTNYAGLAYKLLRMESIQDKREALGSLIASIYYALGSSWRERITQARSLSGLSKSSRDKAIFDEFSALVHEFHSEQRNLSFYSDKMHITPKYLSRVVKQVSGRTAPEWIDSFVVLEAKNMLRHSDMSIKEIISRLNFASHAVFHTFFKKHTGMTPTEYRGKK